MPSPFPGMDPYLESAEWPDVHHRLASEISRQLAPHLRPRYIARIEMTTIQDETPGTEIGIMYPDVQVTQRIRPTERAQPPMTSSRTKTAVAQSIHPAWTVPLLDFQVRLHPIEIRTVPDQELVTSIEILSPYNKKQPGIDKFLQKRERLLASGVHLLDIDLLRRGRRPVSLPSYYDAEPINAADYLVMLTRGDASKLELWPFDVEDYLPTVAVPLRHPDPDLALDLGAVFAAVYDEAAYELSIDYRQSPPVPAFDQEVTRWIDELLLEFR